MAEQLITIGEKEVKFKITGSTPLMYLAAFGTDFLSDFMKLSNELNSDKGLQSTMPIYQMAWIMAKKADNNVPQLEDWLDSFEEGFPVFEVLEELIPLIQANMESKNAKVKATASKKK